VNCRPCLAGRQAAVGNAGEGNAALATCRRALTRLAGWRSAAAYGSGRLNMAADACRAFSVQLYVLPGRDGENEHGSVPTRLLQNTISCLRYRCLSASQDI